MIILMTWKAGTGKDTGADYLVSKYNFKKVYFADTLKRAVKEIFGLTDFQTYDRIEREKVIPYWGYSPRQLFQVIGTEVFRDSFDKDIWVKSLKYKMMNDSTSDYVVSDCRFPNEVECFKDVKDFAVIRMEREGYNGQVGMANHESEKYDLPYNVKFDNNGTIEELYKDVEWVMLHGFGK